MAQAGFFDFEERCAQLKDAGNPLVLLVEMIDFEAFRPTLNRVHEKARKDASGRKTWDVVLMFKVTILRTLYNLSDDQMEYQIRDRVSFMNFLGLQLNDRVPDAKTIWLFNDRLAKLGLVESLFAEFNATLNELGFTAQKGAIVDASIIQSPCQHNTRVENKQIKEGQTPTSFIENPCKSRQKDTDARWVTKQGKRSFGYKNHLNVDVKYKLIRKHEVTDAAVHDSQAIESLLDRENTNADIFGDSAYRSQAISRELKSLGYRNCILEKAYRNRPLSDAQIARNLKKSRVRARVEHVFGRQSQCLGGTWLRCVGAVRARALLGLRNLAYNMDRYLKLAT